MRAAWRSWRRRPLLFTVAALLLALGIGASTAVFSVADSVLLRPLPFADPDRLVLYWHSIPERNTPLVEVSYPAMLDIRARSRSLDGVAALPAVNSGFVLAGDEPARVEGRLVTGNFFDVLGSRAWLGRTFTEAEDRVGAARVVVVSHGLWQRQFGGDPAVVGRPLVVDGTPMTVVGVMPREFQYPKGAELWTPLVPVIPHVVANPNVGWAVLLGRLAPGQSLQQARADLDAMAAAALRAESPTSPPVKVVLTPIAHDLFGRARPALLLMLLAVLLVLLVACANVSALLLARAHARRREIAVRLSLGASRLRLVRDLLAEAALVAVAGGVAGVVLAVWSLDALVALVPAEVPRLQDAAVDARVLAFAAGITALAALASGLTPALLASRPTLTQALTDGPRTAGPGAGHKRVRAFLVAAEVAVTLILLSAAGLLTRTFQNLKGVDLGFDPRNVLTVELTAPRGKYATATARRELYRTVLERVDALPGVEASGVVLIRPLWGRVGLDWPFMAEGQSEQEAERNPPLNLQVVTPGFFGSMRMPVLQGRTFTERDTEKTPLVVVVSQTLARRYWPGQDPVGKRLRMPMPTAPYPQAWVTVAGVVGDTRYRELQASRLDLYMSYLQSDEPLRHLVVRTAKAPLDLAPSVRAAVRAADKELVVADVTSMEALVDTALGGARFGMQLLSGFALAALVLAALGTYGVVAFLVDRRTREIGVRMALGARAANVMAMVLRQGMAPVLLGLLAGAAGSLALGRTLAGLLFGVAGHDPGTLTAASALLASVGAFACLVPARRAARVDPAAALREE